MKIKRRLKLRSNRRFYRRKARIKSIRARNFHINGDFLNAKTFAIRTKPAITCEDLLDGDPVAEEAVRLLGAWSNDVHIAIENGMVSETSNGHTITYPIEEANIKELPSETQE